MNKILVVDDDTDILSLVEIVLTMNDFSVEAISRWELMQKMQAAKLNFVLKAAAGCGLMQAAMYP